MESWLRCLTALRNRARRVQTTHSGCAIRACQHLEAYWLRIGVSG